MDVIHRAWARAAVYPWIAYRTRFQACLQSEHLRLTSGFRMSPGLPRLAVLTWAPTEAFSLQEGSKVSSGRVRERPPSSRSIYSLTSVDTSMRQFNVSGKYVLTEISFIHHTCSLISCSIISKGRGVCADGPIAVESRPGTRPAKVAPRTPTCLGMRDLKLHRDSLFITQTARQI